MKMSCCRMTISVKHSEAACGTGGSSVGENRLGPWVAEF